MTGPERDFQPAWWIRSGHAQTLWPTFFRRRKLPETTVERLELEDGDFLDLAWSGPADGPVVMILHGLEGNLRSHYAGGIMRALNTRGLRCCFVHFRNCSDEPNRLNTSYHSGRTDDPERVARHIEDLTGLPPYGAVGFSLGGNVLLKWLGETGSASPLQRAAVMSVPFRLDDAARRLQRGLSRVYQAHLIGRLRESYRRKFSARPAPLQVDVAQLRTFRAFDDQVTAPLHGFAGVDDYYRRASSRQYIPAIRIPTLILHARDDPFMYAETVPGEDECPPGVRLEVTAGGGHVGFIGGRWPWQPIYWGEERIADWLLEGLADAPPPPAMPGTPQAHG